MRRRTLLASGFCLLFFAACGSDPSPPGPAVVDLKAIAQSGMNLGVNNTDRPVPIAVYQLVTTETFQSAPVEVLQSASATTLGANLLKEEGLILPVGGTVEKRIIAEEDASAIGVLAGFRDASGKMVKHIIPVSLGDEKAVTITIGPTGMVVN